jgi:protease II
VELNYVCMVLMIAVSLQNGIALVTLLKLPGWLFCMQITLEKGEKLAFEEEVYVLRFSSQADFDSTVLNLYYSSLAKPGTWIAYNMITGKRAIKKVTKVLQGFDPEAYVTVRVWAPSHDGVKVRCSPLVISFWALDQLHCRINSEHSRILRA